MRFQLTERINTNAPITKVGASLQANFQRIASSVDLAGTALRVKSIHASFGSINRADTTDVTIKQSENGYLLVADVNYKPSIAFWVILIVCLFTWVFWLVPIIFYLMQKETVKRGIEEAFRNVKNELSSGAFDSATPSIGSNSSIADLEKLGSLLKQGLITQDEFNHQKQRILGPPKTSTANPQRTTSQFPTPDAPRSTSQDKQGEGDEEKAAKAFATAREYSKSGQKDMAKEILKDILKRFPNTKAAAQSRKILSPPPKA